MKTPTTDEVYKWLNDNGIGTGTNLTARSCAEIIRMYVSQFAQPSDVSDEDIQKWADVFLSHQAFKIPLPDDNQESAAIRAYRYGIRTGAKAMRDGKIKPQG